MLLSVEKAAGVPGVAGVTQGGLVILQSRAAMTPSKSRRLMAARWSCIASFRMVGAGVAVTPGEEHSDSAMHIAASNSLSLRYPSPIAVSMRGWALQVEQAEAMAATIRSRL